MSHYFHENPQSVSDKREIACRFNGIKFYFTSDSDVFSKKQIDFGTSLLLDTVIAEEKNRGRVHGRLLDLGCGYGVIGVVMQRAFHHMEVLMADLNKRALSLSRENAKRNSVERVKIVESDGWSAVDGSFDVVMTNPPVRAGKQTVFSFYQGAFEHLREKGRLYVVLQKKQGAPSSQAFLTELFGHCEILVKDSGYWIMLAEKNADK